MPGTVLPKMSSIKRLLNMLVAISIGLSQILLRRAILASDTPSSIIINIVSYPFLVTGNDRKLSPNKIKMPYAYVR